MNKLRILWFWTRSFVLLAKLTLKGKDWHRIYVDLHMEDEPNGRTKRRQLIAHKTCDGLEIYWQESPPFGNVGGENVAQ